ncbi:hypothetical protein Tco_1244749 [Tanacetum coccineum]
MERERDEWRQTAYDQVERIKKLEEDLRPKSTQLTDAENKVQVSEKENKHLRAEQSLPSLRAQVETLFGDMKVRVKMPRVENPSPQSFPQVLPSFEVCTPSVTYPEEVKETLETPMEVEPLDQTKLEYVGLDTCNHNIPLSYREVPSFDELKPQLKSLPNCLSLDISLGDERGLELPIKPQSHSSFRMKVDSNNLLDMVSSCTSLFSLPERFKADNTIRVNH